jgi:hypothetical protein
LIGQKWMADISYEASLTQDTQLVAREVVTGSAERLKVMGSGGAEKVIGEIFTDMINRLNIERLFQQAKLWQVAHRYSIPYKLIIFILLNSEGWLISNILAAWVRLAPVAASALRIILSSSSALAAFKENPS